MTTTEDISELFRSLGAEYLLSGQVRGVEVHEAHDVHLFLRLSKKPDLVVHIQGYPGMSDHIFGHIMARLMDYQRFANIRLKAMDSGGPSVGNEHKAVIRNLIEPVNVIYDHSVLGAILEEYLPEIKLQRD